MTADGAGQTVRARAPGKINVFLKVGSLLEDGYHDVASAYQAVSLYEEVRATQADGYSVRVAYRPEAALDLLRDFRPQVAVLDIGLPGMSGYMLAGRMREQGFGGRLVALTGYGQAADMAASKAAGFDAHLTKPVEPATLLELIQRLSSSADIPS